MSHLFAGRQWVLQTALTQEECVSRLKSKLRGMWQGTWTAERPLYGTVSSSGFAVQFSPGRGRGVNPFHVRGVFTPSGAGTTIRATYGVELAYRLFVAGLASFFLYWWFRILGPFLQASPTALLFFGSTLLLVVYFVWVVRGMIRRADSVREPILDTVAEILEAQISEAPESDS